MTSLAVQMRRLGKHSAVYGLGGIVSRVIAVFLLPIYTRYLDREDLGAVGLVVALSAVLVTILRLGISSAFFRFYFDSKDAAHRLLVVRTSFWFTMASATVGLAAGVLLAEPIADLLGLHDANLVRAGFVGIWAQMNYEQLTSLFRAEERSTAFVLASLANIGVTISATLLLVVVWEKGALGVIVGNFAGTLVVYLALLTVHRAQLGLQFSRPLLREMNRFGIPLVPASLALIVVNFSDRFFLVHLANLAEVGLYRDRGADRLGDGAPADRVPHGVAGLRLLDRGRQRGQADVRVRPDLSRGHRLLARLGLGLLAPWLVRLLTQPEFYAGERVVAPLAFGSVAYAAYIVMAIGVGRSKRTQFNWVITGVAAVVNVVLNLLLIPPYGMMGAAVATVVAYVVMFAGMTWYAQRVFPTPYQWRRVLTAVAAAVGLLLLGRELGGLAAAIGLTLVYPIALVLLGFLLPEERIRLRGAQSRT